MSEIIVDIEPGHERYDKALLRVNRMRQQAGHRVILNGAPVVVEAGELLPEDEQECRNIQQKYAEEQAQKQAEPTEQDGEGKAKKGNGGRWRLLNNWVDYGQHYFSTAECAVWLTIFRLSDGTTNTVKFGVRDLADRAGVSKNTADSAVRKFVEEGVLVCIKKSSWKGVPSIYRLNDATERLTQRPANPK